MAIRPEQIKGLSEWLDQIFVDAKVVEDKIVFVRKNGETVEYIKPKGKTGATGLQLEGERGEPGLDPYELSGYKGSEAEWKESLKGIRGKDGSNGKDGKDGKDGQTPEVSKSIVVKNSQTPSVSMKQLVNGSWQLEMKLPTGLKNVKGPDGKSYSLSGAVIKTGAAEGKIVWSDNVGRIDLTVPEGLQGKAGKTNNVIPGEDPSLEEFKMVGMLSNGSDIYIDGGNSPGVNIYGVKLGKAMEGVTDMPGMIGPNGISGGAIKPDKINRDDLLNTTYNFTENYCTFGLFDSSYGNGIFSGIRSNRFMILDGLIPDGDNYRRGMVVRDFIEGWSTDKFIEQLEDLYESG